MGHTNSVNVNLHEAQSSSNNLESSKESITMNHLPDNNIDHTGQQELNKKSENILLEGNTGNHLLEEKADNPVTKNVTKHSTSEEKREHSEMSEKENDFEVLEDDLSVQYNNDYYNHPVKRTTKKVVTTKKAGVVTTKKAGVVTTKKAGVVTTKKAGVVTTKKAGVVTTKKAGVVTTAKPKTNSSYKLGKLDIKSILHQLNSTSQSNDF